MANAWPRLSSTSEVEAERRQRLVFRMDTISVGIGRSSLVPMLDEAPVADEDRDGRRERRPREFSGQAGLALQILRNLMAGPESAILPPLSGLPSGDVRGVQHEIWRRAFYEKMPGEPQPKRKLIFYRASQKLQQLGAIGVLDPWVWLI